MAGGKNDHYGDCAKTCANCMAECEACGRGHSLTVRFMSFLIFTTHMSPIAFAAHATIGP